MLLRKAELRRVCGRRLIERLIAAKWIESVRANRTAIFYDQRAVHKALSRVQRQGYLLDGHRVQSVSIGSTKVPKPSLEDLFANLSLDL
jgi:hypothetical protein